MDEIKDKKFKVEKVVYYDKEKRWGALGATIIDDLGDLTDSLKNSFGGVSIIGNFQEVYEGATIIVTGSIVDNSKFGKQIQVKNLELLADSSSAEGIKNFLVNSYIKGISHQNAKKIYKKFGENSIDVVLNSPEQLLEIDGIGKKTLKKILKSVGFYKERQVFFEFCANLGMKYSVAIKISETLGEDSVSIIKEDSYKLLDLVPGMSFAQADELFLKQGGNKRSPRRLHAGFLHCLKLLSTFEGSTGCRSNRLLVRFKKLLEIPQDIEYIKTAQELEDLGKVECEIGALTGVCSGIVYFKEYVDIEKEISTRLGSLMTNRILSSKIKPDIVEEEIKNFPFTLNKQQVLAVHDCLKFNVAVLTGASGSGKSSITKALYRIYDRCGYTTVLLSPTAKACRRLEECTGGTASTIHKYLNMSSDGSAWGPGTVPEDCVYIVDEASMLDILLFRQLLKYATPTSRILLIGDNNQLPSVQAGNVLGDLISSGKVHVSVLTDVMRQQEDSHIIKFSTMTNNGKIFQPCVYPDFHYEEFSTNEELRSFFYSKYIEEVKAHGISQVQVITPYKQGEISMNNLNEFLQRNYNKDGVVINDSYRVGDRVRHTRNNYDKNVYNGETGTIIDFDDDDIIVDYGDKTVLYEPKDLEELTLSYVSTVHSSQGSEYITCFVILDDTVANDFLLIRRLLYTAMTRGKKKVYILTKPYLVDQCISNDNYRPRITKLKDFMSELKSSLYS